MKRACNYKLFLAAIGFIAIPTTALHAGTLIADLEANFQPSSTVGNTTANFGGGAGLPDNTGSGHWNYYSLTPTISPDVGTTTYLTWASPAENGGTNAYVDTNNLVFGAFPLPAVGNSKLFVDGATPGADQLAWHPNDPQEADLRWTAGAGETGEIEIKGSVDKTGEPSGSDTFYLYVNGVQKDTVTISSGTSSFDVFAPIAAGQSVDFLNATSGIGGNEEKIQAQIFAVPEPSALVALCGIGAAGLLLAARRRHRAAKAERGDGLPGPSAN